MFRRLVAALPFLLAACGSSGGGLPDTICDPGALRCFGNYRATCDSTGKTWNFATCGSAQYCDAGSCKPRACIPPKGQCAGTGSVSTCNENGSALSTAACETGTMCYGGTCIETPCPAGKTECVVDSLLTCTGGAWTVAPCGDGKGCKDGACVARECTPEEGRCASDGTRDVGGVCALDGMSWQATPCKSNEHCVSGYCIPLAKDMPVPTIDVPGDAAGEGVAEDAADATEPEPREDLPTVEAFVPTQNAALINGTEVKFSQLHDADWIVDQQALLITLKSKKLADVPGTMADATHTIEMRVVGIVEGQTGTFKCEDASTAAVSLWYRFGKYPQGDDCKDYDFAATACTVTIESFGTDRVVGTFTDATLVDCKEDGTTVTVTNGAFDAQR